MKKASRDGGASAANARTVSSRPISSAPRRSRSAASRAASQPGSIRIRVHRPASDSRPWRDSQGLSLFSTCTFSCNACSARLAALQALQEKVQVENKLKPWLSRHGLESLAGLWTRIRIEPGWEAALEAALRERLSALEIGRLDTVRAFAADAPPSRLAFFTAPNAAHPNSHQTLPRLADLLHLGDAGLSALLGDWLEGVYTASDFDAALAARSRLTHGEVIMTREGHAVSQFAVSFYAPDSEQAGLLARAQEIENLDRQTRAQALVSENRAAAWFAPKRRAPTPRRISRRASATPPSCSRSRTASTRARPPDPARRADAGAARAARRRARDARRRARRAAARRKESESRFDALDVELGVAQERQAELDEATLAASAALDGAREAQRDLERKAQEAQFELRSLAARRQELERQVETARQQLQDNLGADAALAEEHAQLTDEPAQAELHSALATRLEHEQRLGEKRSLYDDLSQNLRRADEARLGHEQALQPLRDKVSALQLEEQAAQLGGAQYAEQLDAAACRSRRDRAQHRGRRRQARRAAGQDRRAQPRHRGARRGQPRRARGARPGARAKGLPRRAERRPRPRR